MAAAMVFDDTHGHSMLMPVCELTLLLRALLHTMDIGAL